MTWAPATLPPWMQPIQDTADPYLLIAGASAFADHGGDQDPGKLFGVLIRWQEADGPIACTALNAIVRAPNRLCKAHLDSGMRFATADVSLATLERLLASTRPGFHVELAESLRAVRVANRTTTPPADDAAPLEAAGNLLLGIIDHGCPFAHQELRASPSMTRMHALWDQDPHPDFLRAGAARPRGFGYGSELTNIALNAYMASSGTPLNEDRCYALAGYEPMRLRTCHGAHVLGLMAGASPSRSLVYGRRESGATDRAGAAPVVFVQLPRNVLQAPYGPSVERALVDGVQYVLGHARTDMRVVITIDYGQYLGPHDGSSWVELALREQVGAARKRGIDLHLVFPTGNGREDRTHLDILPLAAEESAELAWHVPLDNGVPTHAELWFRVPLAHLRTEIWAPDAPDQRLEITRPGVWVWPHAHSPACVAVAQDLPRDRGSRVLLRVAPTASRGARQPAAPAGRWGIRLTATRHHASLPKADVYAAFGHPNPGMPKRSNQPFLIPIRRTCIRGDEMLIGTGCGSGNWLVGGYVRRTGQPAAYAARGPSRGGLRGAFNADALAISEESAALPGVVGIANRSGGYYRLSGTSVATPQAARELAQCGRLHPRIQSGTNSPPEPRYSPGPIGGEPPDIDRFLDYYWSP